MTRCHFDHLGQFEPVFVVDISLLLPITRSIDVGLQGYNITKSTLLHTCDIHLLNEGVVPLLWVKLLTPPC